MSQGSGYEIMACPKCGHSHRHDFTFSIVGSHEPVTPKMVTCPGCGRTLEWEIDAWVDQGAVIGWTPYLKLVADFGEAWFAAARRGDRDAIETMLSEGQNIKAVDAAGNMAHFYAALPGEGKLDLFVFMVQAIYEQEQGAYLPCYNRAGQHLLDWIEAGITSPEDAAYANRIFEFLEGYGLKRAKKWAD
jgi:hypothetical protein